MFIISYLIIFLFPIVTGLKISSSSNKIQFGTQLNMNIPTILPTSTVIENHLPNLFRHSLFIGGSLRKLGNLFDGTSKSTGIAAQQIKSILDPVDITVIILIQILYRPILTWLYKLFSYFSVKVEGQVNKPFTASLFGYLEKPVYYHTLFLPSLYILDIIAVIFHALGLEPSVGKYDFIVIFHTASTTFLLGHYLTKIKDWLFSQLLSRPKLFSSTVLKDTRDETIDELTSLVIWAGVILFSLEQLSHKFGFGLSSVFAIGGIGSASIILAMRSTFENFSGLFLVFVY